MIEITRVYHFSAAHRLESPGLTTEKNAELYGPCARPHGHNYYVEVTLAGEPDAVTGMAIDLGHVDTTVLSSLLQHVDHHTLETVPALTGVVTTGEGLARAFWDVLAPVLRAGALTRVRVVETAKNRFEYRGEAA